MKASLRWLCVASLLIAGLITFFYSSATLLSILFNWFPQTSPRIEVFAFWLPVILGFPVYLLAVLVSKRFCFALWLLGISDYLLELQRAQSTFHGGHAEFQSLMMDTFLQSMTMSLLIPAALLQFGTLFYKPDLGSLIARMRRNRA